MTMRPPRRVTVYLLLTVIVLTVILILQHPATVTRQLMVEKEEVNVVKEKEKRYLVDTPVCRIPDIDPFDKSIIDIIKVTKSINCTGQPSLTYDDGHMLRMNQTVVKLWYGDLANCSYTSIHRGPKKMDSNFMWGNTTYFKTDVEINEEFIMVNCTNSTKHGIYKNFHTFVIPRDDGHDKRNEAFRKQNAPKEKLNVLMIGVDSVSRLNFMRQMPRTRKYLLEDMAAVEMQGYTKVADNTFVNIVPMTTGKFLEELPWNETLSKKPMDPYGYIWKNFSSSGYRTLYAEDAPSIAIFNFLKVGFSEAPADHYLRGLNLALEDQMPAGSAGHHCVGDRLETDIVLNYVKQFARTYHDKPHFGFSFLTRLTHDSINDPGHADNSYHKILKQFKESQLLKSTILIFFSDHGTRFGDIRMTFIGKFEERMPFMFFVFPNWFKEKYPQLLRTMNINTNRLTTPFDIHETLLNILFFQGKTQSFSDSNRGLSLFSEIPESRTCEKAGILPHWCMCMERKDLPKDSKHVKSSTTAILAEINKKLSKDTDKCAILTLKEVKSATQMTASGEVLRFRDSFHDVINRKVHYGDRIKALLTIQLTIVTSPGEAMFEATVNHDENTNEYKLSGDISRINKYGDQSKCINNFVLRKYCFCIKK